jgi:hypothetical protein
VFVGCTDDEAEVASVGTVPFIDVDGDRSFPVRYVTGADAVGTVVGPGDLFEVAMEVGSPLVESLVAAGVDSSLLVES